MASLIDKIHLKTDAAWRLGPLAVALGFWGKGPGAWHAARLLGSPPLDPLAGADIRPVWESQRWAGLPREPEAFCTAWMAANPPYSGTAWACGQEAAIRALHLALALPRPMPGWARPVLAAHARRIAANPAYAMAQDNNHPISEAAGMLACGLLLGDSAMARRGASRLEHLVARLVAPDGAFAQPSPAYHRLMLEVLVAAETLRRRWAGPASSARLLARAGAATLWLRRLVCPHTGALPRIGHQDGAAFFATPDDAGPGLAMAEALFGAAAAPAPELRSGGFRGWSMAGARAVLRTGPLRFRPAHADLLHLDLWDGPLNVLRDGGTGAYNPAPANAWWLDYFWSVRAHNTVQFDADEPMPRLSRFLHARWPATGRDSEADWVRDANGRRHSRAVRAEGGRNWLVDDELAGAYTQATLRWRLAPMPWCLLRDGAESAAARITITADAGLTITLEEGWESLAYGEVSPCPVLVARGAVRRFGTLIRLRP